MYLDIGEDTLIDEKEIVLIADIRQISAEMLDSILSKNGIEKEKKGDIKAVIFLAGDSEKVIFSSFSPQTLLKRSRNACI